MFLNPNMQDTLIMNRPLTTTLAKLYTSIPPTPALLRGQDMVQLLTWITPYASTTLNILN